MVAPVELKRKLLYTRQVHVYAFLHVQPNADACFMLQPLTKNVYLYEGRNTLRSYIVQRWSDRHITTRKLVNGLLHIARFNRKPLY